MTAKWNETKVGSKTDIIKQYSVKAGLTNCPTLCQNLTPLYDYYSNFFVPTLLAVSTDVNVSKLHTEG